MASIEAFATMLKDSVMIRTYTALDDKLPNDMTKKLEQLKELSVNARSSKQQETYIKCLMGRNLVAIKEQTFLKGKKLVDHVQPYLPTSYGRSEVYFLISLHKLAIDYNRLMYVSCGTGVLKSKLKLVKRVMESDRVFWANI